MFKVLQKTFATGLVTISYPKTPAAVSTQFRGRPAFDFANWRDARPAAAACPTGAITACDRDGVRQVTVDYGRCVFCGRCAEVSEGAVRVTGEFELAATTREALVFAARYALQPDGSHSRLIGLEEPASLGPRVRREIRRVLGRAMAIRQVDAGSCNGCELEIGALNNPVYDLERFGIHFVASPRHADALLVTGPVTRNMELALRKTYAATPDPKLVMAAGACGISGGIFGERNYACCGSVEQVVPVDVYIPGCPPRPEALLYGILLATGRIEQGHR
jgi:Ni,Fe-hydrogenase III small subunit/formate hydrogenlyase subunit 6/NADH:ubiquinone oxidoreductase subunit I